MKVRCLDVVVNERLRNIDTEAVNQIAESISLSGLLQPIIINEDNILIDGNHRLQACIQLGYEDIECIIKDIEESEAELIEIDTNLCRNDLNPLQQAIHIQKRTQLLDILGKRKKVGDNRYSMGSHGATPKNAKQISNEIGVSRGDYYRKLKIANSLTKYTIDKLIDSQWGSSTIALQHLSKEPSHIQNLTTDRLIKNYNGKVVQNPDKIVRTEIYAVKDSIDKDKILSVLDGYKNVSLDDRCKIYLDDFRNVADIIPNDSISLIYTDPPYPKETIHLYEDLAKFAKNKLKSGCLCMAYCSVQILPQVLSLMSNHLTYYHTICISYKPGTNARVGSIFNEWKPVMMFHKGDRPNHPQISDKITSPDIDQYDKKLHRWSQPIWEPEYYIEKLTKVGDVVGDMMMGTGTTGIATIKQGRKFIGVEINPDTFGMAEGRIKMEYKKITSTITSTNKYIAK